ncbi:MAG TPA: N-acetyl-alpha-D-glucosaminyl L-malate synthase BshA, partial [Balneolaceae bacterium]|nr:N-acetyl-alpha-D-glucosaminyl L-malate synthase BshA [Balneolaceae bacterium]
DDVDCMADYGVKILSNPKLHQQMADNARKQAERFNQDEIVKQYEQFYEEVSKRLKERSESASVS